MLPHVLRRWPPRQPRADFKPPDLGGCVLWLVADRIQGVADGGVVATWADYSGAGNNATGVNSPTWVAAVSQLNGRPAVRLARATVQHFTVDSLAASFSGSSKPATIVVVNRVIATGGTQVLMDVARDLSNVPRYQVVHTSGGNSQATRRGDDNVLAQPQAALTNVAQILMLHYDGATLSLYRDGTSIGTPAASSSVATLDTVDLGALRGGTSSSFDGDIAEVIAYTKGLAAGERAVLHTYLSRRYGITVSAG